MLLFFMGVQYSNELESPIPKEPQLSDALISLFKPYILDGHDGMTWV